MSSAEGPVTLPAPPRRGHQEAQGDGFLKADAAGDSSAQRIAFTTGSD